LSSKNTQLSTELQEAKEQFDKLKDDHESAKTEKGQQEDQLRESNEKVEALQNEIAARES